LFVFFQRAGEERLNMVRENTKHNPEGGAAQLEQLHRIDRVLAAKVDRKTGELIRLRLAVAKAKRLALLREAE
jgi:hypothetical protein